MWRTASREVYGVRETTLNERRGDARPHCARVFFCMIVTDEAFVTLRLPRGGDIKLPRAAAAACDAWSSLKDTDDEARVWDAALLQY